ncbi:MAG: M48 family metalloprotease [Gammaproteobacteria bacterium]|nr:M48 family metalloprotease [Gammaproteobacteria bacterium]
MGTFLISAAEIRDIPIFRRCVWAPVAVLFLFAGCAINPATGDRDFVLMSEAEEIALGRQYHPQVLTQYRVYEDPELQEYVQSLGERLGNNSHRDNLIYRFTVLDSDEVNAFALPGGYIYITRGLMAYLDSEAELAAVLGHEIGHVTARHAAQQQARSTLVGVAGAAAAIGTGSRAAYDLTNVLGTALVRGYGRDLELEADRLGAEYLARTDYRPEAMIEVVETLKEQEQFEIARARAEEREPNVYHGVFSTHPDNDERLQEVVRAAEALSTGAPVPDQDAVYLQHLDDMPFGSSRSEGILKGRDFYHADLAFTLRFPEQWRVENRPDRLVAIAPGDEAVLQLTVEDLNIKGTPRDFLLNRLEVRNPREGAPLDLDGLEGFTAIAPSAPSPYGQRPVRFGVIFYDNQAYVIAGASKQGGGTIADAAMLDTIRSFRALGPDELELAEPKRIDIVEVEPGMTISSLAADSPVPNYPEEQLRLLNGLYPDGELQAGELIKTIQ